MMILLATIGTLSLIWFLCILSASVFNERKIEQSFQNTLKRSQKIQKLNDRLMRTTFEKVAW